MVAFPTGRAEPSALERYKSVFMEIPLYCQEVSRTPSRGPSGAGIKKSRRRAYSSGACFPPLCFCLRGGRGGPGCFFPKKQAPHEASLFPVPSCRLGRSRKAEMRGTGGNTPDAFSAFFPRHVWRRDKKQAPHEAEPVSGAVMPPPAEPEGGNEGARGESFPPDVFSAFSAFPALTGERGGYGYRGRG